MAYGSISGGGREGYVRMIQELFGGLKGVI